MGTTNFSEGDEIKVGDRVINEAVSKQASYLKNAATVQTLLAAKPYTRTVHIDVLIDETFANGSGAKSSFAIGETDTPNKFVAALTAGNAGDKLSYFGTLTANKALIITPTAATGNGTGGITVCAQSQPSA